MSDWVTISSLLTAGGTTVLAIATFSSIRSANRAARVAEQSLLAGVRPVLIPSREDDPSERAGFGDGVILTVPGHGAVAEVRDEVVYMAAGIRNAGAGLAVIHGWHVSVIDTPRVPDRPELEEFRRQQLDIYIPAGDPGFWQGALRDENDPARAAITQALENDERLALDLLYGDYEGGQRTIVRFNVVSDPELDHRMLRVLRYWNVDGDDPREAYTP
jgi:hypothetical protein